MQEEMKILKTLEDLEAETGRLKLAGEKAALVPTMGSFHAGHLSLIDIAYSKADKVMVSIFVNPTQFNSADDYECYPRDIDRDLELLRHRKVHAVFVPDVEEIYGSSFQSRVRVSELSQRLEGEHRPGHFDGVATVVSLLFNLFQSDYAVFGEKDFQQLRIIEQLVQDLKFMFQILRAPLVREEDGLAMSSRNLRLSTEERGKALALSRGLLLALATFRQGERESCRLVSLVEQEFEGLSDTAVEYVSLVEDDELRELPDALEQGCRILAAVRVGEIRLIDNVALIPRP